MRNTNSLFGARTANDEQMRKECMEQGAWGKDSSTTKILRLFVVHAIPVSLPKGSRSSSELVLEDPGLAEDFITHKLAEKLGLPSKPMTLVVTVVEDQRIAKVTRFYRVCFADVKGRKHKMEAIGMNNLVKVFPALDITVKPLYRWRPISKCVFRQV